MKSDRQMSPDSTAQRLARLLGHKAPEAVDAAIQDKFGTLPAFLAVAACVTLVSLAANMTVAVGNNWSPIYLAASLVCATTLVFLLTYDMFTPCGAPMVRAELVREAYGTRAMVLYNVAVLIFFASGSTFNVAGFIWPPWGQELVMSAALVIINGAALITLSGIAIPRSSEGARVKRLSMILTLLGSWLEVSTDCASGVSALRNNQKVFGIIILTSGIIEWGFVIVHTSSALIAHTKRTLIIGAILEIPMVRWHASMGKMAFTGVLLHQLGDQPLRAKLAHIVSLSQTALALISTAAWLFILAPLFFPSVPLATKAATVLAGTPSMEAAEAAALAHDAAPMPRGKCDAAQDDDDEDASADAVDMVSMRADSNDGTLAAASEQQ